MAETLTFVTHMVKLEMVASVLLLAIAMGVVGVLGCVMWFIITKLPVILSDWLTGFNQAVEKLAESVIKITNDVTGTHQNTVSTGILLSSHDAQGKQILINTEKIIEMEEFNKDLLNKINTTLEQRPCIVKR